MSQHRRSPLDMQAVYSDWHRARCLSELLDERDGTGPVTRASRQTFIDLDWVEACAYCRFPVALVEIKHAAAGGSTEITERLALRANLPAYLVTFDTGDPEGVMPELESLGRRAAELRRSLDIGPFSVTELRSGNGPLAQSPRQHAEWITALRQRHYSYCIAGRTA